MSHLSDLPEELILYICAFLQGSDLIALVHVSQRLFRVLDGAAALWHKRCLDGGFIDSVVVKETAEDIVRTATTKVCSAVCSASASINYLRKEAYT